MLPHKLQLFKHISFEKNKFSINLNNFLFKDGVGLNLSKHPPPSDVCARNQPCGSKEDENVKS